MAYLVLTGKPKVRQIHRNNSKPREKYMRKSILFSLLCLIAVVAVACGGGGNNTATGNGTGNTAGACGGEKAAAADPYALYKKKGRNWTHKTAAGHMKVEVVELAEDHAMTKTWILDADKKPMAGMPEPEPTKVEFKTAEGTGTATGEVKEPKKETVKAAGKDWKCVSYDDGKTWMAEDMPGLIVKSEHMELVEFND